MLLTESQHCCCPAKFTLNPALSKPFLSLDPISSHALVQCITLLPIMYPDLLFRFILVLHHAGFSLRVPGLRPGFQSHLRLRARLGAKNGVRHPGLPQAGVRAGWRVWPPARVWFWPWSRVWPCSRIWQADDVKPWRGCAGTVHLLNKNSTPIMRLGLKPLARV